MKGKKAPDWTDVELAMLEKIAGEPGTLISKISRIPTRSYGQIKVQAQKLGLSRARAADLIRELMGDQKARTAKEIALAIDRSEKLVKFVLGNTTVSGPNHEYHLVEPSGSHKARRYVIGNATEAPVGRSACVASLPTRQVIEGRSIAVSEWRLEARDRAQAQWWPAADGVVVGAMNAMVIAGRHAR